MLPLLQYAQSCEEAESGSAALWSQIAQDIDELFVSGPKPAGNGTPSINAGVELLALQGGQVLKQGQPVTDWESDVARVMAFLFASHPQGLSRDRATEMLWPEVGLDRGNSLFHSTLYRLRRSLGKSFIVRRDGLYRINPEASYRYDASEFEGLAALGRGDDGLAHISRLQGILIYKSPFLETCDHDWCCEIRESLSTTMSSLLLKEAQYQAATNSLNKAEELYERLLRFDPLDERAHRGIMWCRAKGSDRSGALRQLRECHDVLQQELGVDPSPETLALGDALLEGEIGPPPD
jgi:two-component SAPR family response regulator